MALLVSVEYSAVLRKKYTFQKTSFWNQYLNEALSCFQPSFPQMRPIEFLYSHFVQNRPKII